MFWKFTSLTSLIGVSLIVGSLMAAPHKIEVDPKPPHYIKVDINMNQAGPTPKLVLGSGGIALAGSSLLTALGLVGCFFRQPPVAPKCHAEPQPDKPNRWV
jgi:hypothetical protein